MNKIFTFLFLCFFVSSFAQRDVDERSTLSERLYFGGGLGFGTGTGYTQFSLSPIVGYMVTPKFSAGMGLTYQNYSYSYTTPSISVQQYGFSPFARYNINELFLYGEFNALNSPTYISTTRTERAFYTRLLAGLGYTFTTGRDRGGLNAVALYDLAYKNNGIFQSPWVIRVFFTY